MRLDVQSMYKWSKFDSLLSLRQNSFGADLVCDEIVSAYAQQPMKSFPRMLSQRMQ
jgi:hypothetical protein